MKTRTTSEKLVEDVLARFNYSPHPVDHAKINSIIAKAEDPERVKKLKDHELSEYKAYLCKSLVAEIKECETKPAPDTLFRIKELIAIYRKFSENARSYKKTKIIGGGISHYEQFNPVYGEMEVHHYTQHKKEGDFEKQLNKMDKFIDDEIAKQLVEEQIQGKTELADKYREKAGASNSYNAFYENNTKIVDVNLTRVNDKLRTTFIDQNNAIDTTCNELRQKIVQAINDLPTLSLRVNFELPSDNNYAFKFKQSDNPNLKRFSLNPNTIEIKIPENDIKDAYGSFEESPVELQRFINLVNEYNAAIKLKKQMDPISRKPILAASSSEFAQTIVNAAKMTRNYEMDQKTPFLKEVSGWKMVKEIAKAIFSGETKKLYAQYTQGAFKFNMFHKPKSHIYKPLEELTGDHKISKKLNK